MKGKLQEQFFVRIFVCFCRKIPIQGLGGIPVPQPQAIREFVDLITKKEVAPELINTYNEVSKTFSAVFAARGRKACKRRISELWSR